MENPEGYYFKNSNNLFIAFNEWDEDTSKEMVQILEFVKKSFEDIYGEAYVNNWKIAIKYNKEYPCCSPNYHEIYLAIRKNEINKNYYIGILIYQFAHELCHVMIHKDVGIPCNMDKVNKTKSSWFEETICELSSLYFLSKLKDDWENFNPLELNSYTCYEDTKLYYNETILDLPRDKNEFEFSDYFRIHLNCLELNWKDRLKNRWCALEMLPIFQNNIKLQKEKSTNLWHEVKNLQKIHDLVYSEKITSFKDFLYYWQACSSNHENKTSIHEIIDLFKFTFQRINQSI